MHLSCEQCASHGKFLVKSCFPGNVYQILPSNKIFDQLKMKKIKGPDPDIRFQDFFIYRYTVQEDELYGALISTALCWDCSVSFPGLTVPHHVGVDAAAGSDAPLRCDETNSITSELLEKRIADIGSRQFKNKALSRLFLRDRLQHRVPRHLQTAPLKQDGLYVHGYHLHS